VRQGALESGVMAIEFVRDRSSSAGAVALSLPTAAAHAGYRWLVADQAVIAEAGRRLVEAAGESAQVILLGSHARGDARPNSDLDFLVIKPKVESRLAESVRLRRALRGLGVAADVVVVSADHVAECGDVKSTMLHDALTEGRVLAWP
jgi:uncharacterized protein